MGRSGRRSVAVGAALAAVILGVGCHGTQPDTPPQPASPQAPVVDVKRLMSGMVDPSADAVWQAVAITIDRTGEHHTRPTTAAEWLAVQNHAMTVAESANLLMIAPRARDAGDWIARSRALREAGARAYEAALKQDPEALLTVGGEIYDACAACHTQYLPPESEDPV